MNISFPEPLTKIPAGDYTVRYVKHKYRNMFGGQAKLIITVAVIEYGDYFGVELQRFYNVERLAKSYRPLPKSDLTREMQNVFQVRSLKGISLFKELKKIELVAEVRDVTTSSRQQELSEFNCYSVVARLKGKQ